MTAEINVFSASVTTVVGVLRPRKVFNLVIVSGRADLNGNTSLIAVHLF